MKHRSTSWWAGLALLIAGDALAARRAEVAVVGLHVQSADDEAAKAANEALLNALKSVDNIEPVSSGEVRGRLAGREDLVLQGVFLGPGQADLAEGRVLYERADFESAVGPLTEAVEELQDGLAGATDSKDLIDALLLLGLAQASLGDQDAARAAFKRVAVLDPSRQLDAVNYPPKMVGLFNEVRDAVRALPTARLEVRSEDAEAQVYVDGLSKGKLPVSVTGLPPGTHYVLVTGSGGKRVFSLVELAPDEKRVFSAALDSRSLSATGESEADRSRQVRQLYTSLGAHIATGLVILGGETGDGNVALQLYEPRTGNFTQVLEAPSGADPVTATTALVPKIAAYITDDGTLRPEWVSASVAPLDIGDNAVLASILLDPEPIVEIVTVTRGPPWYVWTGIAAVAAGGAAGTVLLLTGGPDELPDPDQGTVVVGPIP